MRFEAKGKISHPVERVMDLLIDELECIVPFLTPIDSIETHESQERCAKWGDTAVARWRYFSRA